MISAAGMGTERKENATPKAMLIGNRMEKILTGCILSTV